MEQETKYDRRSFLGSAAMSIAAAKFVVIDSAPVESKRTGAIIWGATHAVEEPI